MEELTLEGAGERRRRRAGGTFIKNLLLFFILLVLILASAWWLDYIGLINLREVVYPTLAKVPVVGRFFEQARLPLTIEELRWEELKKRIKALDEREARLNQRAEELENLTKKLDAKSEELAKREEALKLAEQALQEDKSAWDDYTKNVEEIANLNIKMPPDQVAERFEKLDDLLIIDIFRKMEELGRQNNVTAILQSMDPERAAVLYRKMSKARSTLSRPPIVETTP
ncbi:MAG: periplasmic-type flagellar collar protein FlbB [bacterium]